MSQVAQTSVRISYLVWTADSEVMVLRLLALVLSEITSSQIPASLLAAAAAACRDFTARWCQFGRL